MSISRCKFCDNQIDEDFDVEHLELCSLPEGYEVVDHNYDLRVLRKYDGRYYLQEAVDPENIIPFFKSDVEKVAKWIKIARSKSR